MKADLDSEGVLTITAESPIEAFALRRWAKEAFVNVDGACPHQGIGNVRGDRLLLYVAWPPKQKEGGA